MLTANNIDAARKVQIGGGLTWQMDERVGDNQLGRETYDHNQIDKGHLVRREDVLWGTVAEARAANKATYFYSNASPQHKNFNQDEWKALEDWVLERATDLSYRLCVFTGPVFTESDPTLMELPPELRAARRCRRSCRRPSGRSSCCATPRRAATTFPAWLLRSSRAAPGTTFMAGGCSISGSSR